MTYRPSQDSCFMNAAASLRDARTGGMAEGLEWLNRDWEPPTSPIEGADDARTIALQKITQAAGLLAEAETELQEVIQRHRAGQR
ncbi:hypothetical protein [Nocardia sp. alder85J]|uniref:hypothetical protein n=1 Tax=Nocardia sp. alder85J TaxID=2862949 RepID=UPI001CD6D7CF|nr:hypothetical protein [Nocardia sp. alder85J]MCX4099132.1 hypothetical protein [Nocardia sp. alder85J]